MHENPLLKKFEEKYETKVKLPKRPEIVEKIGDATTPIGDGPKIIAHVCNDIGRWGKGFVLSLSRRWREPERQYLRWERGEFPNLPFKLGAVQLVEIPSEKNLWVANMIGQHKVKPQNGLPPIRYSAIAQALEKVAAEATHLKASVHMPRIGAHLAGGDWKQIRQIIENKLCLANVSVTVYRLKN